MLLTLVLYLVQSSRTDEEHLRRCIITFIPFFIYAAIRVNFGMDYSSYEEFFDHVKDTTISHYDSDKEHMEIGFALFTMLLPSFRVQIILTSLLVTCAYITLFYRYIPPKYGWLGIVLLFLTGNNSIFFDLVAMRNGMVVAILFLSMPLIEKRNWKLFVIPTVIAWTIHSSAALYFPLAYILSSSKEITKKRILLWVGIMGLFTLVSSSAIANLIAPYVGLADDSYNEMITEIASKSSGVGFVAALFAVVLVSLLLYIQYADKEKYSPKDNMMISLALLFSISYLLGALNMRTSQYFVLSFVAAVPIIASTVSDKSFKVLLIALSLVYTFYSFYVVWVLNNPYFVFQNYHSIFD